MTYRITKTKHCILQYDIKWVVRVIFHVVSMGGWVLDLYFVRRGEGSSKISMMDRNFSCPPAPWHLNNERSLMCACIIFSQHSAEAHFICRFNFTRGFHEQENFLFIVFLWFSIIESCYLSPLISRHFQNCIQRCIQILSSLDRYSPYSLDPLRITWLFAHCKGGNFNIHIWAWFGYFIC